MKTALIFRPDGRLQAIFKIDDEEKFKIVLKTLFDFPYYIELVDDIPTLSSILKHESSVEEDQTITLSIKDRYNSKVDLTVYENVVTYDNLQTVCTLEKFKKIFN